MRANSTAMASMSRQNIPIHAVPSTCSRRLPAGRSGWPRSKMPMLSRPRKPPWKALRPSGSLRLTHQVKFSEQLVEDLLQEVGVGAAGQRTADLVDAPGGVGVDRRVDVAEVPLVGRELAVGVQVPLAQEQEQSGASPTRGRAGPGRMQWKARSQAAYQGYSHLSGTLRTSRL